MLLPALQGRRALDRQRDANRERDRLWCGSAVTAQVIQSHLWKPERVSLFYTIIRLAFSQLPLLALLVLSVAESLHE